MAKNAAQEQLGLVLRRDDGKIYRIPLKDLEQYEIPEKKRVTIERKVGKSTAVLCYVSCISDN
jgi:hypothetical protein